MVGKKKRVWLLVAACLAVAALIATSIVRDHRRRILTAHEASRLLEPTRWSSQPATSSIQAPKRGHVVDVSGTPVDLSAIIDRTHFAFHERQGSLQGGDVAYGVRLHDRTISIHPEAVASPNDRGKMSTVREMTPSIACDTSLSCVNTYRKFDPNDTTTKSDRVVARVLSY